jgi:putative ABC transport system permease protein
MAKKIGHFNVVIEPLLKARLHSICRWISQGRGNYQFLLIMVGLSVLILILSIVNYINLATANAVKRAKEVGVRKLWCFKSTIVIQFILKLL